MNSVSTGSQFFIAKKNHILKSSVSNVLLINLNLIFLGEYQIHLEDYFSSWHSGHKPSEYRFIKIKYIVPQ